MTRISIVLIRWYQKTLSPDHGWLRARYPYGYCRYYPTCSQYALESLETHGLLRSLPKIIWRIGRCNPLSAGGHDPVIK
ncbi:MAG: membrane protein insertion efficiency factor YidD [Candidatus Buchananbacteria bacterium]|nr:membrane protein insertion efficiency factor YidD [Candidatus Buchananbacteria bacterium]